MEIASGKYTFIVDVKATKTEIRLAVEKLFQVKVVKVNTMNIEGKTKDREFMKVKDLIGKRQL